MKNSHIKQIRQILQIQICSQQYFQISTLTGRLEIPYWIDDEYPVGPIDIWGSAGKFPKGFVGAGWTITEFWTAGLLNQFNISGHSKKSRAILLRKG